MLVFCYLTVLHCVNNSRSHWVSSTNKTYLLVFALILQVSVFPFKYRMRGYISREDYGTLEDYDRPMLKVSILYTNFYDSGANDEVAHV
jgi:hypothetical protein